MRLTNRLSWRWPIGEHSTEANCNTGGKGGTAPRLHGDKTAEMAVGAGRRPGTRKSPGDILSPMKCPHDEKFIVSSTLLYQKHRPIRTTTKLFLRRKSKSADAIFSKLWTAMASTRASPHCTSCAHPTAGDHALLDVRVDNP